MSYKNNKEAIQNMIYDLTKDDDIIVLMAVAIGSRAYGCAGPNSDYDIRFIYKRPEEAYLDVIGKTTDQLIFPINNGYDIVGWDISKVTKLAYKSNVTLLDWIMSPIIYYDGKGFRDKMVDLVNEHYQVQQLLGGYSGVWKSHTKETLTVKSGLNLYRTSLQAEYVFENNDLPPMDFNKLLKSVNVSEEVLTEIKQLINEKANGKGEEPYKLYTDFCSKVEEKFRTYPWEKETAIFQKEDKVAKRKNALNKFFIQTIRDQV